MTRINSAIPVRCLTDEHLLAEHREIKRLPYYLHRAIASGSVKRIPERFTLGRGHVLFFLDKMVFAWRRYRSIYAECDSRNFYVENYEQNFIAEFPECFCSDYTPTSEERQLLIERITERIRHSRKKKWHYHGKPITQEQAVQLLNFY